MACKRCGYNGAGSPCPVCWPGAQGASTTDCPPDVSTPKYVPTFEVSLQEPSVPTPDVPTEMMTSPSEAGFCDECGVKPVEGRYKLCAACRKRAYRERSRG